MTASLLPRSRTLLLGTDAPFSAAVFAGLVQAGIDVVAIGVDGDHPFPPLFSASTHGHRETLASLATARGVPLRAIPDPGAAELLEWSVALAPEFILVACFSRVLPEALCAAAASDCLNLHPSLLPRYRGPAPLFWQLRAGEPTSGITLHRVTPTVDAGPIVAQARVALDGGLDGAALEERFAAAGVSLYRTMLDGHVTGQPQAVAQQEARASWHGPPHEQDFRVDAAWRAERIFNFMRGTCHWGRTYRVTVAGREFPLREALACEPEGRLTVPYELSGESLRLRCNPGTLHASLA